jgi:biopolymer transport protein ExbD
MAGGGGAKPSDGAKKARIEIIPLIDVIFFLLATFVLFTLSLNKLNSLPVQLPVASNEKPDDTKVDDTVTIQASEEDTCYYNKELVSFTEIPPRLQNYAKSVAKPRVLIAGDDKSRFGMTVRILDEVRKSGIKEVSVETRVRPTGK